MASPGRGASLAIVATAALTLAGLVIGGRPAAPGAAIADHLPDRPVTRLHTDVAGSATWQVNQGVLPAPVAWDELSLLARRHQQPAADGHWLTVDLLDPATPAGRLSLDFQVESSQISLRVITLPDRSVSLDPGVPVLTPVLLDGADLVWEGTLALDDAAAEPAAARVHARTLDDLPGCVQTQVVLAERTEAFTWCSGEQAGLAGWRTESASGMTGFTPLPGVQPDRGDPAGPDEMPVAVLTGEPVREVSFFRVIAGAYREQAAPHGSRVTWAADQLVVADTEGRVTSWLPIEDQEATGSYYSQIWRAQPGGSIRGLVAHGTVTVLGTTDREVVAYDRDGWELWRAQVRDGVTQMSALDDVVVVLDAVGDLTAFDPRSGEQRWRTGGVDTVLDSEGEPAAVAVLAGSELRVVDAASGLMTWSARVDPRDLDAALIGSQVAVITGSWLVVRDTRTGALAWSRAVPGDTLLGSTGPHLLVSEPRTAHLLAPDGESVWISARPMPIAVPLEPGLVLGVLRDGLVLDGPGSPPLTWSYPDDVGQPDLEPLRGDLGIVTLQLQGGRYQWWEYR